MVLTDIASHLMMNHFTNFYFEYTSMPQIDQVHFVYNPSQLSASWWEANRLVDALAKQGVNKSSDLLAFTL